MRHHIRAGLFAAILGVAAPAWGQNFFKSAGSDIKHGVLDIPAVWASPFRASGRGLAVGAASVGAVGLSAFADDDVAQWIRNHPDAQVMDALKPFREDHPWSLVNSGSGNWYYKGALAAWGTGLIFNSRGLRDLGMGCAASAQSEGLPRGLIYMGVSRERPLFIDTIAGEPVERAGRPYRVRFPGDKSTWYDNSFFGGHNANVVACVSFVTKRYHLGVVEPLLWGFAGAMSLGRMADQRHYTSDVLLGGLVGYGAGRIVGDRSRKRMEKQKAPRDSAAAPDSARSWMDGLYMSRRGAATVVGWRHPF